MRVQVYAFWRMLFFLWKIMLISKSGIDFLPVFQTRPYRIIKLEVSSNLVLY